MAARACVDIVQLHGSESPEQFPHGMRVWKAFRVTPGVGWRRDYRSMLSRHFLLDGPTPGSGEAFDWTLRCRACDNIILAGGLGPDNVADAIRRARPWGVDACSRLERAPGLKDHEKMRRFVRAAMESI